MKILVLNGPNLCALGKREPEMYGNNDLHKINNNLKLKFQGVVDLEFFTTNYEGDIITKILDSEDKYDGIVLNPGAYAHYSIAILDSIRAVKVPVVEVHLTNISDREEYRKQMVTAAGCIGCISGFAEYSYALGVLALMDHMQKK